MSEIINCRFCNTKVNQFMTFGQMPIANSFLNIDEFENEYFFELFPTFCPKCSLFQLKEEKILYLSMNELKKIIKNEQNKTNFKIFRGISKPINDFLDNVMVNVQDKKIQNNRKNLLLECQTNINHFFNFSSL